MPKKQEPEQSWMVPVRTQMDGTIFVTARSKEEAKKKALAGEWEGEELGECSDWEIRGEPVLNE
jgi:hypothetical protein